MSGNKGRNFRRRAGDDDEDKQEQNTGSYANASTVTAAKATSKSASVKPKKIHQKLLSFADDEGEEDTFKATSRSHTSFRHSKSSLSSSSASHKISYANDRIASSTPLSSSVRSNVQPQAGQYSKEALLELQRSTKTLGGAHRPPPPRPPSDSNLFGGAVKSTSTTKSAPTEPIIVLKGSVKPISDLGSKEDGKGAELDEESEDEGEYTRRKMGLMGIGKGIPDQAMINAIKAQKERARRSGAAAPDYIALDMGSNHGEAEGLSDEEPEFRSRIAMVVDETRNKKGVFQDVDDEVGPGISGARDGLDMRMTNEVVEDEDDEEDRRWEEEQFRKGLGKRMDDGTGGVSTSSTVHQSVQRQKSAYPLAPAGAAQSSFASAPVGPISIDGVLGGMVGSEVMSITQRSDVAKKALKDNLRRVKESHAKTMMTLARSDENLSASLTNITGLEQSLIAAGEKFLFMQKLRDFVSLICDFLQDKAPYLEELEEQMQKHHRERATANFERRTADDSDEMLEAEAAVSAAMSVFSKGGNNTTTFAAASSAAQAALAAMKEKRLPAELDEMGRDLNLQKRMDMIRRAEARRRRRDRWESKMVSSIANEDFDHRIEGESSTDESDDENETAYRSHRDLLLETAAGIFCDANDEYSQLILVKERFNRWKKDYARTYRDAYMSLSAPAIFSPYVRLELLKWDPLHEETGFSGMNWHSMLFDYGYPEDESDFPPDDIDANLVPGLVEKVAVPILQHDIAHCWDTLSTRETKNAVFATTLIIDYIPSCEALKELITTIRARLAETVACLVLPSWSTFVMKAVPLAARFASYRFGVAIRLMRNIILWKDILAFPVLEKLLLDDLLSGKVLPHVRSLTSDVHDSISRTERIVDALTGLCAGSSVSGTRSQKLQPLIDHIVTMGKVLERKHASGDETTEIARRLKKMLVDLNEYDKARAINRTFQLKEAL